MAEIQLNLSAPEQLRELRALAEELLAGEECTPRELERALTNAAHRLGLHTLDAAPIVTASLEALGSRRRITTADPVPNVAAATAFDHEAPTGESPSWVPAAASGESTVTAVRDGGAPAANRGSGPPWVEHYEPPAAYPPPLPGRPPPIASRLASDLGAYLLGLLGVLLALALIRPGSGGTAGSFLVDFLRLWMGAVVHVSPLLFFGGAVMLALDYRRATNKQLLAGVAGMLFVLFGWIHLTTTLRGNEFDSSYARMMGLLLRKADPALLRTPDAGFVGALIMAILFPLGRLGSFVTLAAVGVASLLWLAELTLRGIIERRRERSRRGAASAGESRRRQDHG